MLYVHLFIEYKGIGLLVLIIDAPVENNPIKLCVENKGTCWKIQNKAL